MSYEMYEVVKQYHFEILGFEPVKAEIWKTIKPNMNNPYMWKASHIHSGYAPNHGNSLELAEEELLYYIEHFDIKSAKRDPFY